MPPKTAAERMKIYRMKMSAEKRAAVRQKNSEQQKKSRTKWDKKRLKMEREASKRRMRSSRNNGLSQEIDIASDGSPNVLQTPSKAFSSVQSLGKAVSCVKRLMPKSPRKKVAVVRKLASTFGLLLNQLTASMNPSSDPDDMDRKIDVVWYRP